MTIPKETIEDKETPADPEPDIEVGSQAQWEEEQQQQQQQEEEEKQGQESQKQERQQEVEVSEPEGGAQIREDEEDEEASERTDEPKGSNTEEKAASARNADEKPNDTTTTATTTTTSNNNNSASNSNISSRTFSLPKAVYCPITKEVMQNPVVHPDGESYEKSAIMEKDPAAVCYPNRALKSYIEKEWERLKHNAELQEGSLRNTWEQLLETAALPFKDYHPLPDSFYCPITFDLICEPVIDADGYTYEQAALINWIKVNFDSPVTRQPLSSDDLYKNKAMLKIMLEMTDCEEENMHPPLLRWKQELGTRPHAAAPLEFEMITVTQVQSSFDSDDADGSPGSRYNQYPTTHEELNAIRRRNVQVVVFSVFTAAVFSLVLYIFSPRYFLFLVIFGSVFYCIKMAQARRRAHGREPPEPPRSTW